MILKYGTFTHDESEVSVTISKAPFHSQNGKRTSFVERWTIDGFLQADNTAATTTKIQALLNAYAVDGRDLLFFDGADATAHGLTTSDSINGVEIVEVSFPEGRGAEYSTFRSYRIVAEAEYSETNQGIISWSETISITAGGPRFIFLQTLTGLPQRQQVAQAVPFRAIQSGTALGHLVYPAPAIPIWPADQHVEQSSVTRRGPVAKRKRLRNFQTTWNYIFESATGLNANPTVKT